MRRNNRITIRLNTDELERLNDFAATLGGSQSGALRLLLLGEEKYAKIESKQRESAAEISQLKIEISELKTQLSELQNWLKEHIE
jgi:hypothetical protein